jgi:cell division protein FtsW (lipid II flippase)
LKNPSLVTVALLLGAYLIATRAYALIDSERVMRWIKAFPRNRKIAPFLTAVVILWTAWWVHKAAGESESFKGMQPIVVVGAPIAWLLLVRYMDSFLNSRAFAALILLLARPVVMSAFLIYSPWRFPVTIFGYIMAVSGIIFGFSPHLFRDYLFWHTRSREHFRKMCLLELGIGIAFLILGGLVYPRIQ